MGLSAPRNIAKPARRASKGRSIPCWRVGLVWRTTFAMTRYRWAQWGDINAFFGLMLDNLAVMIILVSTISLPGAELRQDDRFSPQFVLTHMIPGTALGVLLGDLLYTWMAFRLARRTGRSDV